MLCHSPDGFFRNQNKGFSKAFQVISGLAGVTETNDFGGAALAYMAVAPDLPIPSGGWYDTFPPGRHQLVVHAPSTEAQSKEAQRKLWELSAKVTGA